MKKTLLFLSALLLAFADAVSAQAQPVAKVKSVTTSTTGVPGVSAASRATQTVKIIPYAIGNYYAAGDTDNFYMMFAEKQNATYDGASGTINAHDCEVLFLDVYTGHIDDANLPVGEYTPSDDVDGAGTYCTNYSYIAYYDANGNQSLVTPLTGNVSIKKAENGNYVVTACTEETSYTYAGPLTFRRSDDAYVYDQINADIVVDQSFKTGLGNYEGNLFQSNTGNMYINLYNVDIDTETGAMKDYGYDIAISAFHVLFADPKKASVRPGTYTMARNFKRETFYPGMEVTYMEMTIPFGSYVKQLKTDGKNYYAYITDGTITITQAEDGSYSFTFDCVTADGHTLTGSTSGVKFTINDLSDDKPAATVSTLEEDHELDLDYVKTAHVYKYDDENDCSVFVAFIGMPSGEDGIEGDLFRMEFLTELGSTTLPAGNYELMEENHRYTNLYAPYKLVQGYFNDNGALIGTRYLHYEEGRNCIMDHLAPVVSGNISVEDLGGGKVRFDVDTYDDAFNRIYGIWQGNVTPGDIISGISELPVLDRPALRIDRLGANHWLLCGVADGETVEVYNASGTLVSRSTGAFLRTGSLMPGVYVVKAADFQPVKIIKK